jgi:hypothetical protein
MRKAFETRQRLIHQIMEASRTSLELNDRSVTGALLVALDAAERRTAQPPPDGPVWI